jgi:hypothetical protein
MYTEETFYYVLLMQSCINNELHFYFEYCIHAAGIEYNLFQSEPPAGGVTGVFLCQTNGTVAC